MNVLLLCLVLPLGFVLLVYDAWLVYQISRMSEEANRVAWGGLRGRLFYVWVLTFVLSSFGCTSSFVLYASGAQSDGSATFLFLALNASYIAFNYALLRGMQNTVLACLWTNVVLLTALFVYTAVAFDARSDASTAGLLFATHVCNFVAVFHVYVMDIMVWYDGWIHARDECRTPPEFMCQT
jgi:hypothetical protein